METIGSPTGRRSLAVRADGMMICPPGASPGTAKRVRLSGAVQGIGRRPFVHRLAAETGLAGFVRNGADGVTIEVEGGRVADFLARLSAETPPLARIDALPIEALVPAGRCLANRVLAEGLQAALAGTGITAWLARKLPPGDGGLSFRQAIMGRT